MYKFVKTLMDNASKSRDEWAARRGVELLIEARRQYREYEDLVDEWWRNGDGKRHGFIYPRCRHGASLWVDHDMPCWECENEGSYFDYLLELRKAKDAANAEFDRWFAVALSLRTLSSVNLPWDAEDTADVEEACEVLRQWVFANWPGYSDRLFGQD